MPRGRPGRPTYGQVIPTGPRHAARCVVIFCNATAGFAPMDIARDNPPIHPPTTTPTPPRANAPQCMPDIFFTHQSCDAAQALGVPHISHPKSRYGVWSQKPRQAASTTARLFEGIARICCRTRKARRGNSPTTTSPRGATVRDWRPRLLYLPMRFGLDRAEISSHIAERATASDGRRFGHRRRPHRNTFCDTVARLRPLVAPNPKRRSPAWRGDGAYGPYRLTPK